MTAQDIGKATGDGRGEGLASAERAARTGDASAKSFKAKVRMYRQGLGDCFLVTLPRKNGAPYNILIDCGVILGTPNAADIMRSVVKDIRKVTCDCLDLVIGTHEHWDHLSGFLQAQEEFDKLTIKEAWLSWVENPDDPQGRELREKREALKLSLQRAEARMRLAEAAEPADELAGLLDFFGARSGSSTKEALDYLRDLAKKNVLVRYAQPEDEPARPNGTSARIYVLGPPRDESFLKRMNPSTGCRETYGLSAADVTSFEALGPLLIGSGSDDAAPFNEMYRIPLDAARQHPFFKKQYWGGDADADGRDQSWRRIDGAWLESALALALKLDRMVNNTSLALAIELEDGEVLLFAADAQVGNWLSWQNLKWRVEGKETTGPGLLSRVVMYKVGHHGSHNATLRENGLELMDDLEVALIPVDHEMASKRNWGNMPLPELVDRLEEKARKNGVIRADAPIPKPATACVSGNKLFYELVI